MESPGDFGHSELTSIIRLSIYDESKNQNPGPKRILHPQRSLQCYELKVRSNEVHENWPVLLSIIESYAFVLYEPTYCA